MEEISFFNISFTSRVVGYQIRLSGMMALQNLTHAMSGQRILSLKRLRMYEGDVD